LSVADYSLTIFVALNIARALAYGPQIVSIHRDPGRASAVSLWTWIVFTTANVATVIHALTGLGDVVVAAVFGVNAIGCAVIVALITYKRCRDRLPVWESHRTETSSEPDYEAARREGFAIGAVPGMARARMSRSFAKWRAARWAAYQRRIQYIAGRGPFTIE